MKASDSFVTFVFFYMKIHACVFDEWSDDGLHKPKNP